MTQHTALVLAIGLGTLAFGCGGDGDDSSASTPAVNAPCRAPQVATVLFSSSVIGGAEVVGDQVLFIAEDSLQRIALAGGSPQTITSAYEASGLTVTGDTAYFMGEHPVGAPDAQGKQSSGSGLYAASIQAGDATLVSDGFFSLYSAADEASAYFATSGLGTIEAFTPPSTSAQTLEAGKLSVRALASHGDFIYVAAQDYATPDGSRGIIVRVAKSGGAAKSLISLAGLPNGIAVDDHAIYWIEEAPYGTFGVGHISSADLDGKNPHLLAMADPSSIALDADHVYFASDKLSRVAKHGGAVEVVASGLEGADVLRINGADAIRVNLASRALSDSRPSALMAMCLHAEP